MGLDVYLYRCPNRAKVREIEDAFEKRREELFKQHGVYQDDWSALPEAEKEARRGRFDAHEADVAQSMGLVKGKYNWQHPDVEKVELPSQKYPDELFNIGYWRSSYNDGGINRVLERLGLPDLYDIAGHEGEEYEFAPDWHETRLRAALALDKLRKVPPYDVLKTAANIFSDGSNLPRSDKDALALAMKAIDQHKQRKGFGGSFGTAAGDFFLDEPLEVVALIPGIDTILKPQACTYVVYKTDSYAFYARSLEIVIETCEYVLAQKDPENYYQHWSG